MKTKVCILFGGKSLEHEVSILSTKNLLSFFNRDKYEILIVGIDRKGFWHVSDETCELDDPKPFHEVFKTIVDFKTEVVFPILHGLNGEDGTIQGLLEIANLPYVGPSVLSAAIGLDKDVMKRLAREAGLPVGDFISCKQLPDFEEIKQTLGLPIYIKPANMGSSVGISVAYSESEFVKGFAQAKKYDAKVVLERKITGRELECSVMGLEKPIASLPCEIVLKTENYSYEEKYSADSLAECIYPAQIDIGLMQMIQQFALKAYDVFCSEIMARVDFFYTDEGELLFNEINTIPGFTSTSMFVKMWEVSNVPTDELVDRLIDCAFQRHAAKSHLQHKIVQEAMV